MSADGARLAYRLDEVAVMLTVDREQLEEAVHAGILPALRVGARTTLVPVKHLPIYRQWVAGDLAPTEEEPPPTLPDWAARLEAKIEELEAAVLELQQRRRNLRKQVPAKIAAQVIERDQGLCRYCGRKIYKAMRTIDHVVPVSRGGDNSLSNLVLACSTCNAFKRDRVPEEADMELLPIGTWKRRR